MDQPIFNNNIRRMPEPDIFDPDRILLSGRNRITRGPDGSLVLNNNINARGNPNRRAFGCFVGPDRYATGNEDPEFERRRAEQVERENERRRRELFFMHPSGRRPYGEDSEQPYEPVFITDPTRESRMMKMFRKLGVHEKECNQKQHEQDCQLRKNQAVFPARAQEQDFFPSSAILRAKKGPKKSLEEIFPRSSPFTNNIWDYKITGGRGLFNEVSKSDPEIEVDFAKIDPNWGQGLNFNVSELMKQKAEKQAELDRKALADYEKAEEKRKEEERAKKAIQELNTFGGLGFDSTYMTKRGQVGPNIGQKPPSVSVKKDVPAFETAANKKQGLAVIREEPEEPSPLLSGGGGLKSEDLEDEYHKFAELEEKSKRVRNRSLFTDRWATIKGGKIDSNTANGIQQGKQHHKSAPSNIAAPLRDITNNKAGNIIEPFTRGGGNKKPSNRSGLKKIMQHVKQQQQMLKAENKENGLLPIDVVVGGQKHKKKKAVLA